MLVGNRSTSKYSEQSTAIYILAVYIIQQDESFYAAWRVVCARELLQEPQQKNNCECQAEKADLERDAAPESNGLQYHPRRPVSQPSIQVPKIIEETVVCERG
jgi:hypothetical protein